MASGTIKKTMVKTYNSTTAMISINSGAQAALPVSIPSDCTEILAVIPVSLKVGSTYGSAVPAIVAGVTINNNLTATIAVRAYANQTYAVQYTLLYR